MARKNTQAEELYEVAVLLLAHTKTTYEALELKPAPLIARLILRAEKATKARPK